METICGDAHVHLHPGADLGRVFATARARGAELGAPLLLLLAESQGVRAFERLAAEAGSEAPLRAISEPMSLQLADASVYLVAGRQVVSREGIEVLFLALDPRDPASALSDREHPADELLARGRAAGAAVVLPWGVGKWLGVRGRRVAELARAPEWRRDPLFFLGDIAHRATPWPRPRAFDPPARVLAGSDALPLAGCERHVAAYGFRVRGRFEAARPAGSLLEALAAGGPLEPIGRRASLPAMLREQLLYRLRGPLREPAPTGADAAGRARATGVDGG